MPPDAVVTANLHSVRRRIDAAAHRVQRSPSLVSLVAVSKTFPADLVRDAARAGQRAFGENRVQEGAAKRDALGDASIEWHLIGHLQSNKARKAVAAFDWIQSIDSLELLAKVDAAAGDAGRRPRILVQADLAGEATKHGADQSALAELVAAAAEAVHVDLRGLMIVPPFAEDPEEARPWFGRLRDIRDALIAGGIAADRLADLSMGMSHDFEVAIEEGATIVRVGTAIFGRRDYAAGA